jgi:DNA-binding MarR family transcriptional regulator
MGMASEEIAAGSNIIFNHLPAAAPSAYGCHMQSLPVASKRTSVMDCAREMLDAGPPMMWYIRRAMRSHRQGLSMPQFRAMVMISNQPSVSLSCVAEHLAMSLPTTSRIITGLVNKGFLKREGSTEDRRQMSLGMTARGQAVLSGAWAAAQEGMAGELKRFSPEQRATIAEAMKMVKEMFGSLGLKGRNYE